MSDGKLPPERIRLVFDLERADNVRLYDELIQFKKGPKRVNRLRTLAHEGLFAQHRPPSAGKMPEARLAGLAGLAGERAVSAGAGAALIMNQVFDEPLDE